jgi:hypothetical protein
MAKTANEEKQEARKGECNTERWCAETESKSGQVSGVTCVMCRCSDQLAFLTRSHPYPQGKNA